MALRERLRTLLAGAIPPLPAAAPAVIAASPAVEPEPEPEPLPEPELPIRSTTTTSHPNGHFYSPVVDTAELAGLEHRLWPPSPHVAGIDFDDASHERILREAFPRFLPDYDYPEVLEETPQLAGFFTRNSQFSWLDARAYFVLLRHWQPRRVVEIGSGFSTLLAADVNRRFLDGRLDVTCIEPYPRPFLLAGVPGVSRLLQAKVQDVDLDEFGRLQAGDVLFVDSSHVAKTGSDVNFIYFEVLPRLADGVRVHIHDIHLPHEYPRDWVIEENRSWNEQYLVRALLMDSRRYAVEFGCSYAFHRFPELVGAALGGRGFGGGSLWIRVREDRAGGA